MGCFFANLGARKSPKPGNFRHASLFCKAANCSQQKGSPFLTFSCCLFSPFSPGNISAAMPASQPASRSPSSLNFVQKEANPSSQPRPPDGQNRPISLRMGKRKGSDSKTRTQKKTPSPSEQSKISPEAIHKLLQPERNHEGMDGCGEERGREVDTYPSSHTASSASLLSPALQFRDFQPLLARAGLLSPLRSLVPGVSLKDLYSFISSPSNRENERETRIRSGDFTAAKPR